MNGMQGIQMLRKWPFDMVITDRALTGMSGDEAAKAVKELHPNMPVILLTGCGGMMNV
ncbi:MAG: response regulator [Kiritimatiellae bacterium]|nr:response regulator [Kiritimatiellia bacterium]